MDLVFFVYGRSLWMFQKNVFLEIFDTPHPLCPLLPKLHPINDILRRPSPVVRILCLEKFRQIEIHQSRHQYQSNIHTIWFR